MPPRLPARWRLHRQQGANFRRYAHPEIQSTCLFCSLSTDLNKASVLRQPKKRASSTHARRFEATVTATTTGAFTHRSDVKITPRKELESILLNLQTSAANYVNLSRLQLALNGLRQEPGHESIRLAILGLPGGPSSSITAKEVLRLLLADPLKDFEDWEQEIEQHDLAEPLIVRIGVEGHETNQGITLSKEKLMREIHVSSATLNDCSLEVLLADAGPSLLVSQQDISNKNPEITIMVPTIAVQVPNSGGYTSITTPVHKVLVVGEGIRGAASVISISARESDDALNYAVHIPEYKPTETSSLPFVPIDTNTARAGLGLIRTNIGNAMEYERLWFQSNVPKLVEWLKADILTTPDGTMKPPVRQLIASVLKDASASILAQEKGLLGSPAPSISEPKRLIPIETGLSEWAESAHSELQGQLDIAFSSDRWQKLRWWKLFWRVDDVGMLTSDILSQRFLYEAERSSIFLAGRMREIGVSLSHSSRTLTQPDITTNVSGQPVAAVSELDSAEPSKRVPDWPVNITNTRNYLQMETVPALQALAQSLVFQTASTSGLVTALGALAYTGTLTTTLYEAGAVAALGIVWSMKRMQTKWETARGFWEGEVREEGRKAVRGVEEAVASALARSNTQEVEQGAAQTQNELTKAHELVTKAEKLLAELK